jgi:hypothetical protein
MRLDKEPTDEEIVQLLHSAWRSAGWPAEKWPASDSAEMRHVVDGCRMGLSGFNKLVERTEKLTARMRGLEERQDSLERKVEALLQEIGVLRAENVALRRLH